MRDLVRTLSQAQSWRHWGLAFAAGGVSVMAMAPLFAWPVLFLAFPVLVWLVDGVVHRKTQTGAGRNKFLNGRLSAMLRAGATGWMFGFGYFLFGLFWIGEAFLVEAEKFAWLMPFAICLMPAGLALFYGLAVALSVYFWPSGCARIVILALSLTVCEWLRGHILTGFPWNSLGYALTGNESLMQSAAVVGVDGLVHFAVLIFASPAVLFDLRTPSPEPLRWRFPALMLFLLAAASGAGYFRLQMAESGIVENVRIRIVQPNIPQIEKWQPRNRLWIFRRNLDLSRRNAALAEDGLAGVTHLIWPEVASPFLLAQSPEALKALADLLPENVTFLTGAIRAKTAGKDPSGQEKLKVFNSIYVMDHEARILATYDKIHLVPFGEYLPLQNLLESIGLEQLTRLRGGFTAGRGSHILKAPGLPVFSALICYEIIFSGAVSDAGVRPAWLLNVTNDAWFGRSAGPYQHFHQARVRAVEEGVPVVRAANTGVSAIIDPYGRIVSQLPLHTPGVIDGTLPRTLSPTVFARLRTLILVVLLLSAGALAFLLSKKEIDGAHN